MKRSRFALVSLALTVPALSACGNGGHQPSSSTPGAAAGPSDLGQKPGNGGAESGSTAMVAVRP
jgi:hypothetical protein